MSIVLSDQELTQRIEELAKRRGTTPEKIVAEAMQTLESRADEQATNFWTAIRGLGDSGDPDLAHHLRQILRQEVDEIEGWLEPDTKDRPG